MNSSFSEARFLGLRLSIFLFASALAVTGCGGSSSSSSNNSSGGMPVFGEGDADNSCYISNMNAVDLACYLVPGGQGEEPTLTYATYVRQGSKFVIAKEGNNPWGVKNGKTDFSWSNITKNKAEYKQLGVTDKATTHFEWNDTDNEITQIDKKGEPDEDTLVRPLTPVIDNEESVTNVSDGNTYVGDLMVFKPKTRTIKVPSTNKAIKAHNAIMAVQIFDMGVGIGLVSVEHYVPDVGAVALTHYTNCPDVASLEFKDNAAYYAEKCMSSTPLMPTFDWTWILEKKE